MKKLKIILTLIFIAVFCFYGNISNAEGDLEINSEIENSVEETVLDINYQFKEDTNTVLAIVTSNNELKDTKVNWTLSDDKKQYTFEFTTNTNYTTNFEDIYGNILPVEIHVTQIREKTEVRVEYSYNPTTNTVIATVISNNELKATKVNWTLSEDKKQYSFEFTTNTTYTTNFEDVYGEIIPIEIHVTQIKDRVDTVINIDYQYKEETNTVLAIVTSNNELKDTKVSWTLSENKRQYTFEFNANTTYTTNFEDIYGKIIPVEINVTQVQKIVTKVRTENNYNEETNTVLVTIIADHKLQDTKVSWTLSENEKQYTFEFNTNTNYTTNVIDVYGNVIPVEINVTEIDETPAEIEVLYDYNEETNTVLATMSSNIELQDTKVSWTLSEDKKKYTFEFTTNTTYNTNVIEIIKNVITIEIHITQIDDKGPEVKINYEYSDDREQCTVTVTANEEMMPKVMPDWVLSEDKLTFTRVFNGNINYSTVFKDKYGNETTVQINVFLHITGIDVSRHQGKIDWQQVKNAGIEFAIIRCGYGQDRTSQDDEWFEYNVSECERLGIPYGVYLYSYAVDLDCANSEADHVLRLIEGKNPTYGIWYDLEEEVDEFGTPIPNEMLVNIAITFCEKMKANGYDYVGIYANLNWFETKLNDSRLDQYPKWVAQWNDECTYEKDYDMWQYTSSGQVPGIDGRVDMNKYYKQR